MELSRCYHTVLLSGVKTMGRQNDDVARRFIALVDECYDRGCLLLLTSIVAIAELYQAKQLEFAFARCESRLYEMQRWPAAAPNHSQSAEAALS